MTKSIFEAATPADQLELENVEILNDLPEDEYHSEAESGQRMSSHKLGIFARSPAEYWQEVSGLIPRQDRMAYRLGRAFHCLALEGSEAFAARYDVGGPTNKATGKEYATSSKAWRRYEEETGREAVTHADSKLMLDMLAGIHGHDACRELLASSDYRAEVTIRGTLLEVPVQIRVDWSNPAAPEMPIADLKTCGALRFFAEDARSYRYYRQFAFYRLIWRLAFRIRRSPGFVIAACEKKPPNAAALFIADVPKLEAEERDILQTLREFARCRDADDWPTGWERIRTL